MAGGTRTITVQHESNAESNSQMEKEILLNLLEQISQRLFCCSNFTFPALLVEVITPNPSPPSTIPWVWAAYPCAHAQGLAQQQANRPPQKLAVFPHQASVC